MTESSHYTRPNTSHPGSSADDIRDEPDWTRTHNHRIGFRDRNDRHPGLTHHGDEWESEEESKFLEQAKKEAKELEMELGKQDLVDVREFMAKQEDYHLRFPAQHPLGWRYVLHTTEDFIKFQQNWPANVKRRQQEDEKRQSEKQEATDNEKPQTEHEWRKSRGENKTHHEAHATNEQDTTAESESVKKLKENDGKKKSPVFATEEDVTIDETDQFTPDNWIPRSPHLIRQTGKHPLNGEPELSTLFDAGLITPNHLHYVRNHGPVPHILWETHTLDIENGKMTLSMDDLETRFDSINIAVALACDGNRRKELNLIRRSKGFNWGPGAIGCAFWKGPMLRDVLLAAGVKEPDPRHQKSRRWVHFEGSDELSEGKYATSIPLAYAMCPENDVILAYEMNNNRLPPDHGYPVRVMIPGYVGGRCVKWVRRIWTSDAENDSHYHIWDNRVLPSFILDMDSEFSHTMFHHPSTACNEQNLNSVIVKPAHGEKIPLSNLKKDRSYRIEGLAYDGGGHEIQRVEVSLDGGENWLYCVRKFPEYPLRHGKKFWTWLHWYVDVGMPHLVRAKSITVRCFNVFKNTQPERPAWNLMGMMNNCWYIVQPEIQCDEETGCSALFFRHPCEPGTGKGGWVQPSVENRMEDLKQQVSSPQKQFTRQEIENHNTDGDCWIVINDKVYDATSVLSWHPGGKAAIMSHAGRVHVDTTDEFESIHDDYAQQKLNECAIGVVTEKAKEFMKKQAEESAKEKANSSKGHPDTVLDSHRWSFVRFIGKKDLTKDTRAYTFSLPKGRKSLGLSTCQHLQLGFHFSDRLVVRPYTPTRPVLEKEEDCTFDLVVKTYFPDKSQPGGTMSNILDCLRPDEEIEVKGPTGEIKYVGNGKFLIDDKEYHFDKISLVLGGSGITPGYQLIARILSAKDKGEGEDKSKLKVIDANKTESDILLRSELDQFAKAHPDQFQITHVLSRPGDDWKGENGHVTKEILEKYLFGPEEGSVALLCGPPTMIKKAVLPALQEIGFDEDKNLFGF
ncbi:hypothetical protein N7474_007136 [Penicillium riverlandense]|uniref:uncharacterized protein n=1 Tax=Penicillium riverlandense TaxID=1903569 RepID=UPI002547FCBE|nr:uncharacterized protein N7474_007136 [Penicillium riverlandense]KAJ5815359.1 hypothetical protein N7474_007136 [Penicillium riverlandense]